MYGYSLSSIEKELIFRRKDTGYVRPIHSTGQVFYLDPSPFLKTPKRDLYYATFPPPGGALIQASVDEVRDEIYRDKSGYYRLTVKTIENWKFIEPKAIHRNKSELAPEEVLHFFTMPFSGEEDNVNQIALCSLLYAVSSPPIMNEQGGIHAAILGEKRPWNGFQKCMKVIPSEFKRPSSDYFYKISPRDEDYQGKNKEVNLAYLNPDKSAMHIPVVFDEIDVRSSKSYHLDAESLTPFITGFVLDSLLLEPEMPEGLEKNIMDAVHEVMNDFKGSGFVPYKQDFSDLIPKLGLSIARFHSHGKLTSQDIQRVVELWTDMFYKAKRVVSTQHEVSRLYRLDDNSRKLYLSLLDAFTLESPVPITEIRSLSRLFRNSDDLDKALHNLNLQGLIIITNQNSIRILDFDKKTISSE